MLSISSAVTQGELDIKCRRVDLWAVSQDVLELSRPLVKRGVALINRMDKGVYYVAGEAVSRLYYDMCG